MELAERKKRIAELKSTQNRKILQNDLTENDFPEFLLDQEPLGTTDLLWGKINEGEFQHSATEWNEAFLESTISKIFADQQTVYVDFESNHQTFAVQFQCIDILNVLKKLVARKPADSLFCSFFFTRDLSRILLILENEYDEIEVLMYEESE